MKTNQLSLPGNITFTIKELCQRGQRKKLSMPTIFEKKHKIFQVEKNTKKTTKLVLLKNIYTEMFYCMNMVWVDECMLLCMLLFHISVSCVVSFYIKKHKKFQLEKTNCTTSK